MCFHIYITCIYYIYIIHRYMTGVSLLGDRGNPPTSKKFAHSPCT